MRQVLGMIQLVVAIALMGLIGQALLYLLAGENREKNVFYQILRVIPSPFVKLFRLISPRALVADRLIPFATFCGLAFVFLWLAFEIPRVPN